MKKALGGDANTVCWGSQKFYPLPGGAEWPKFNQLEMVSTFT